MFRKLFHRNVALLVGVVLAGQILAAALAFELLIRPQSSRMANVAATMVEGLSTAMAGLEPDARARLIAQLNKGDDFEIQPLGATPANGTRNPTMVERQFVHALETQLKTPNLTTRADAQSRLWVRLPMGGEDYWVTLTPRRRTGPTESLIIAFLTALLVAVVGGVAIQRYIDRPLRRLQEGVDRYDAGHPTPPLDETGPDEIAAVARAFNRMTERVAAQEAERALMLAGVSHDLRTPLTKLHLALDMMRPGDRDMEQSATRQVAQIETMLGQFLEFARGFEAEERQELSVAEVIGQAVGRTADPAAISLSVPADLKATIRPNAVERAVTNLLANALQHGAAPVRVEASLGSDKSLSIAITDAGLGLDPAATETLRRPFARGDVARSHAGTGLGLAIADRVAQSHNGRLTLERLNPGFRATLHLR